MTTKDLITLLKQQKQDLPVVFEDDNGNEAVDFTVEEAFGTIIVKSF